MSWTSQGATTATGTNVSNVSANITTTTGNTVVVVFIHATHTSGTPTISSVSGGSLTWTKKAGQVVVGNNNHNFAQEIWWAPASSTLTSQSITVTGGGTYDHISFGMIAFHSDQPGWNINNPWDGDPAYFKYESGTNVDTHNPSNVPHLATVNASTLVLGFWASNALPTNRSATLDGWTDLAIDVNNTAGTDWSRIECESKAFNSPQSDIPILFRDFCNRYGIIGVALTDTVSTISSTIDQTLQKISQDVQSETSMTSSVSHNVYSISQDLSALTFLETTIAQTLLKPNQLIAMYRLADPGNTVSYSYWT